VFARVFRDSALRSEFVNLFRKRAKESKIIERFRVEFFCAFKKFTNSQNDMGQVSAQRCDQAGGMSRGWVVGGFEFKG
jgi:hypothetical protein